MVEEQERSACSSWYLPLPKMLRCTVYLINNWYLFMCVCVWTGNRNKSRMLNMRALIFKYTRVQYKQVAGANTWTHLRRWIQNRNMKTTWSWWTGRTALAIEWLTGAILLILDSHCNDVPVAWLVRHTNSNLLCLNRKRKREAPSEQVKQWQQYISRWQCMTKM